MFQQLYPIASGLGVLSAGVGSMDAAIKPPGKNFRRPKNRIPEPHKLHKVQRRNDLWLHLPVFYRLTVLTAFFALGT